MNDGSAEMKSLKRIPRETEKGIALLMALLLLVILSLVVAGYVMMLNSEQRVNASDRQSGVAFYAAEAGLEKMTVDISDSFTRRQMPTAGDINAMTTFDQRPPIASVSFPTYSITFPANASGNPQATVRSIQGGPYAGLIGDIVPFTLSVSAQASSGEEVMLRREVEAVLIPVFQFGVFSDADLSFFAGPPFTIGGRVHANGNLFLAEGDGGTLWLQQKVTSAGVVVRQRLANGHQISSGYTGNVRILTVSGGCNGNSTNNTTCRPLLATEGSVVDTVGSAANEPTWTNRSLTTYNGNIRSGTTGAKVLSLPFTRPGVQPIELVKRSPTGEDPASLVSQSRYMNQASLRILISDNVANLPGGTGVQLNAAGLTAAGYVASSSSPTRSPLDAPDAALGASAPWIKIEMQNAGFAWQDVTAEILNLGIGSTDGNAIVKLVRPKKGLSPATTSANDYWPINLYDAREGERRDETTSTTCSLAGVMNLVELDVNSLRRWFTGAIGASGPSALNVAGGGYILYYSDRRGNMDAAGDETGEFGDDDIVNPASQTAVSNGVLDPGENVDQLQGQDNFLVPPRVYGDTRPIALPALSSDIDTGLSPNNGKLTSTAGSYNRVTCSTAQSRRQPYFRRALRLVNGALGNLPMPGFTVASENPVYVLGHYNASSAGWSSTGQSHASIIADAVTLLSETWKTCSSGCGIAVIHGGDDRSFQYPNTPSSRAANTSTWYRTALAIGRQKVFPKPTGYSVYQDFGTDGGTHNWIRYLEYWNTTSHYKGSLVSFYFNRQATGVYKCCTKVYNPPTRDYSYDADFLDPTNLPPGTPKFRDINNLSFTKVTF
jgi:hypothetical protein